MMDCTQSAGVVCLLRRIAADFDVNLGKPTQSREQEWHGRSVTVSISVVCVAAQIFNGVLCIYRLHRLFTINCGINA